MLQKEGQFEEAVGSLSAVSATDLPETQRPCGRRNIGRTDLPVIIRMVYDGYPYPGRKKQS